MNLLDTNELIYEAIIEPIRNTKIKKNKNTFLKGNDTFLD
jgi:hypothetical protein